MLCLELKQNNKKEGEEKKIDAENIKFDDTINSLSN